MAFRASLTAVYQTFYGADNIVDSIARLPRWLRLTVPVAAAAVAGSIARLRSSRTQGHVASFGVASDAGSYALVGMAAATAASKALGDESVYEAELRKRGLGWEMTLEGRQLKDGRDA